MALISTQPEDLILPLKGASNRNSTGTADHLASFGCSAFQTGPQIGGAKGKENRLEGGCEFCLRTQPFEIAGRASVIAVLELRHPAAVKRRQVRFGRSAWLLREEIATRKKPPSNANRKPRLEECQNMSLPIATPLEKRRVHYPLLND